jgi:glycosyltransferase involved in cell wall biosynthesis
MTIPKIAFVLKTDGFEYDDRIRKECITLSKSADVTIFVTFDNNEEEEGVTSYGIPYKSFSLVMRKKLPSGKFLLIKALEFYLRVRSHLKSFDLIWAHEEYAFLFPLLTKKNKYIWDLHEIPALFDRPFLRSVFHYIEKRSKKIIHANDFRIQYLKKTGFIKNPQKHAFIRNYPDERFLLSKEIPVKYDEFKKWLDSEPYVYLQGLSVSGRYPYNSIASVLDATSFKIVVIGPFEDRVALNMLHEKYPEELEKRVFFAGMIDQLAIPVYLRNALFTIVLYDISKPNNRYCEANRFYQAINFGIPVIVGSNETMSEITDLYNVGIALKSDGCDLEELRTAINQLLENYDLYKRNAESCKKRFVWNDDLIMKEWYA